MLQTSQKEACSMDQNAESLLNPRIQKCPFDLYKKLRNEKPVAYMADIGMYYVTDYQLGRQILTDPKRFLNGTAEDDGRIFIEPNKSAQQILREKDFGLPMTLFSTTNAGDHEAYRDIVEPSFKVSGMRKLEARIAETARELVEKIAPAGTCDAVQDFAIPLPTYVIADILGVPRSDYATFKRWSDGVMTYVALQVPEAEAIAGAESMVEMHRYMIGHVRQRRAVPRDDLLTIVAQSKFKGERLLTDLECVSMIDQLLVAGNETTTHSIASGLLFLAQNPQMQGALRERPEQIAKFAEEILRLHSPLQVAIRRTITDITLGGVNIPAGSRVLVSLASANRDENKFAQADAVNLERGNAGAHLTFGSGTHHCLGAELARLEMRESFRAWVSRFSSVDLAQDSDSIEYHHSWAMRGPLSLKLKYTAMTE
jgi:cytochrome P450